MVKSTTGAVIEGTVELLKSKAECACHPGKGYHVYCENFRLGPYNTNDPPHFERNLDRWLRNAIDFEAIEGKTIRITAEVL